MGQPGFVLCDLAAPCLVASAFFATLVIIDMPKESPLFSAGTEAVMHLHTATKECSIEELVAEVDKRTRKPIKKHPTYVRTGALVIAKVSLKHSLCFELFGTLPAMGRFTLRIGQKTVAVGKISKTL